MSKHYTSNTENNSENANNPNKAFRDYIKESLKELIPGITTSVILSFFVLLLISLKYDLREVAESEISEFFIPSVIGIYFSAAIAFSGLLSVILTFPLTDKCARFVRTARAGLFSTYVGTLVPFLCALVFLGIFYWDEMEMKAILHLIGLIIALCFSVCILLCSLFFGLATPVKLRGEFGLSVLANLFLIVLGSGLIFCVYIEL